MTTTINGKEVKWSKMFPANGTFQAYYDASAYLKDMGYIVGSMCGPEPIGFADADKYDYVAKWYNISPDERKELDGVMLQHGGFREGSVEIIFFNTPKF